ncbi:centrosomal protein of 131 kDa isoform X2 [Oryzias latipes]|uniref:Centrosomal protein 131 n=1 Tax=Oryzias latipes TaxID=8090 RepID=H2MEY7_ORYLA|nr:centrosomal protein of 131 kDa isoform X2 [Oryzias latipes]
MMHTTKSPSSLPKASPGEALDLSLSGSQLSISKRPSSASPGKCFSRSISVSVAGDSRTKRNPLGDANLGSSRSVKNLRRSNSTTQVNQQATLSLSPGQTEEFSTLFESSSDGRRKLASLSRTERTTWNILDDQPRASAHNTGSMESPTSLKKKEPGVPLAASFTANNRSNKGTVGNSVTTILHNNYSEKPLTPKSSNQKPSFNNLLKATANDEVSLENSSVTKSQKNFCCSSSASNNRTSGPCSPASPRRRDATEEEAERFIQQVNQAAVTIQRWYRRHAKKKHSNKAALKLLLARKKKEWQEKRAEDALQEQQRKLEERKQLREEKARLARLAAIQELQQKRLKRSEAAQQATEVQSENLMQAGTAEGKKLPRSCSSNDTPVLQSNSVMSPTHTKSTNTDSNMVAELEELSFRAISPASSGLRGVACSQEQTAGGDVPQQIHKENSGLSRLHAAQGGPQRRPQPLSAEGVQENLRHSAARGRKKPLQMSSTKRSSLSVSPSPSNNGLMSPAETKTRTPADGGDVGCRAASPALSNPRGFQCSQERAVSMEEQRRGPSGPPSKTTLNELLDTLKLLEEEEPQRLPGPKFHHNDKYAWIDKDADSNSLTTDNLERHGQMNHQTSLPDGGALLSEAKLQSIMSFLDEMETSEQERPRSITSGSQREALLSEDELLGTEQASAEVTGSMMRLKMELEEKRRSVSMLQTALAQQRELTARHVKEMERELSRSFQLQKEQYEATIQRHLAFIDQLISDKKALSERCEGVVTELKQVDLKYTQKIAQMQQQHEMEIKKLKDLMSASEKIRRERWIDEKTKKIKEITVKGLEPEIQKLLSKHKQELKKLRTLHEAELLQADERAAQRYVRQCEELRLQLEKEKEEQCQRERDLAKQRYEKQLQEEELSLQQQRRRLYKEVSDDKERLTQLAARQRSELEDLRRQLEENSRLAERALREELEKSREEQEKRHQMEVKVLQERLDMEKQTWEESFKNKEEAWMLSREREMKEELRRERDKEIELAIWTLEEETSKDKAECERAADNRVRRLREKYEAELRELESSERAAVEKQQELRRKQLEMEEQLVRLQTLFRQQEAEMEGVKQTRDKLAEERCSLTEVIRQEFAERLVAAEEENRRLKLEVSEVRARLRLEVDRVHQEKEEELAEVHQRVKSAILKKEETVKNLRGQYEAALKRADHLEALWEQQRKQLLEK